AWAQSRGYSYDARFRRADGQMRWMHVSCNPRLDEKSRLVGYVGMAVDLTEQKQAEDELRESEARFRAMADSAPSPVWVTNEEGIEFANQSLVEFTGLSVEQLRGDAWTRLCHPNDLPMVAERRGRAWEKREPYEFEARFRRHDGEWRWLRASCKPRQGADAFLGYVGMAVDVTESRRAEEELRASEALLRAMFDNAGVGMVLMDSECRIERANAAFCAIVGRGAEELAGTSCLDFTHPDDVPANMEAVTAIGRGASAYAFEKRYSHKSGRTIWVRITLSNVDEQVLAIVEDVTARKRVEEALRESEEWFRALADNIPTLCWMADEKGWIFWYNRRWYEYTGKTPAEMEGWGWESVHDPVLLPAVKERWQTSLATGEPFEMVFPLRGADGTFRPFLTRVDPLCDEAGRIVRWFGTNTDIAEVKELETALRAEGRVLETINRVGASLAGELDLERVVQMVTDAGVEVSGGQFGAFFYNVLNAAGESYMLYTISGVDRAEFEKFPMPRNTHVFAPTFAGEGVLRSDDITADARYGQNHPYKGMPEGHLPVRSYLAVPVTSRSGEVIGGLFFGHAEPGRFSERHEELVVGIAGQAAVAIDNARLFEAAQREIAERRRAEEALRELNLSLEARIAAAIAERQRAEEALRQAQKMEAVGQLTGGIAHDFNNLLTVISGNLDLAARRLGSGGDPKVARAINSASIGADRAATLTQRLLAFSRRQPLAPKAIDPNALLAGMTDLLHRTLGETIEVETRLAGGLSRIEADPHQLESAILNLAVNARDAMPEGGRLVIETASARVEPGKASEGEEIAPGQYVVISVSDTGFGMDADTLKRAVEPFFTTKEVGKGTGLGLSMVYGFVRQSGGHLRIESEEGVGTSVHIYLPRMGGDSIEEEQAEAAAAPRGGGEETILVCEDDDDVRAYTLELLGELGYRVLEAQDGPTTLRLLQDPENRIDLLFTDVVLPSGMSGAELAREARAQRPGLKVLFTTGYARDAIVHDGRLDPGVELVAKPFSFTDLASRIRDVLDR
ncbi:MAG: PAS domain S-box protein, partial [Pseudomonadota bacterium]|nr:PAS domain S-box protein [Pseudomonadota bacterium]